MPWMMDQIHRGFFEITNPYNRRKSHVPGTPDKVHTIVFWSKNFGPFIEGGYGEDLRKIGYHLFFNFTVNSEARLLEPNVPPLAERLHQLETLACRYDPRSITWRFDPICFYRIGSEFKDNLNDFAEIAEKAATLGVRRCVTSFADLYPKVRKRKPPINGFTFLDPPLGKKKAVLLEMAQALKQRNMQLHACCEKEVLADIPETSGVRGASCIPNDIIVDIFGGQVSLKPDRGQRIGDGCGCMVSVDIGSYQYQPCSHNCLFCYANPVSAKRKVGQR
jgi:Domain of unknown function (DUF1848)